MRSALRPSQSLARSLRKSRILSTTSVAGFTQVTWHTGDEVDFDQPVLTAVKATQALGQSPSRQNASPTRSRDCGGTSCAVQRRAGRKSDREVWLSSVWPSGPPPSIAPRAGSGSGSSTRPRLPRGRFGSSRGRGRARPRRPSLVERRQRERRGEGLLSSSHQP